MESYELVIECCLHFVDGIWNWLMSHHIVNLHVYVFSSVSGWALESAYVEVASCVGDQAACFPAGAQPILIDVLCTHNSVGTRVAVYCERASATTPCSSRYSILLGVACRGAME